MNSSTPIISYRNNSFSAIFRPSKLSKMIWQKRWFQASVLMVLAFIWGSSFILMKIGLKSFTPDQAGALRIVLASLVLLPVSLGQLKNL